MILDLGPDTIRLFNSIIQESKMVIWNGPLGLFEVKKFAKGTNEFSKNLIKASAFTIIGGGDTISAVVYQALFATAKQDGLLVELP